MAVEVLNTSSALSAKTLATLEEFAASGGSALSGFLQAGTGAVARTVQAALRDARFSVKDFGALGDGVNDDTAEIDLAIAACQNAGGGTVYFPPGTYVVSESIALAWNLGGGSTDPVILRGAGWGSAIQNKASAGKPTIVISGQYFGIEDLSVIGHSSFPNDGIKISGAASGNCGFGYVSNVLLQPDGKGIVLNRTNTVDIHRCWYWPSGLGFLGATTTEANRLHAVYADCTAADGYANDITIDRLIAPVRVNTAGGGAAIYWNNGGGADLKSSGVRIINCEIEETLIDATAVLLKGVQSFTVRDNFLENADVTLHTCRYGWLGANEAGATSSWAIGDGTANRDCFYLTIANQVGGTCTVTAFDSQAPETLIFDNCTWQAGYTSAKGSRTALRSVRTTGSVLVPDQINMRRVAVPFAAGDFTSSSGTFVVAAGDVKTFEYALFGQVMRIWLALETATITGTPSTLYVTIPAGRTAAKDTYHSGFQENNAGTRGVMHVQTIANDARLYLTVGAAAAAWAAGADNNKMYCTVDIPLTDLA